MASDAPAPRDRNEVLGRRIAAALIDLVVVFFLAVLFAVLFGQAEASGAQARAQLEGAPAAVFLGLILLYYGLGEAISGQTLGKRVMRVRVVRVDGRDAGVGAIAIRTLLRLVDGILFYLVGLVTVLATGSRRQRLGDLAAGTTVVDAERPR